MKMKREGKKRRESRWKIVDRLTNDVKGKYKIKEMMMTPRNCLFFFVCVVLHPYSPIRLCLLNVFRLDSLTIFMLVKSVLMEYLDGGEKCTVDVSSNLPSRCVCSSGCCWCNWWKYSSPCWRWKCIKDGLFDSIKQHSWNFVIPLLSFGKRILHAITSESKCVRRSEETQQQLSRH